MMVRAHILVNGIVQGVFFRFNTMRKATEFGITGWVKNRRDGRVEVLCEGSEDNVKTDDRLVHKRSRGIFCK